jgi:predicted ATPase
MLADAYRMAGKPHDALAHLAEAQRLAEASHEAWVGAETHRLRGDALLCTGDFAAAETSYHEATALARRQSAKLFELRSATSLARLWRARGDVAEARNMLAPVYAWFTEGFDAPDLVDAKRYWTRSDEGRRCTTCNAGRFFDAIALRGAPDQFGPAVEDRQDLVALLGHQ